MKTRLGYGAVAVLLILGGWLLGSQQTTDAQLLSSGRWTIQSAGQQSAWMFIYNPNSGVVYQFMWGGDCGDGYLGLQTCLVPVQYPESGN